MVFSMRAVIEKKKLGQTLAREDIDGWIAGVVSGAVPDYQSAALLMAVRLNGMSFSETVDLTRAMTESGDRLVFDGYPVLADKHSTGGVGDKVTLILAPILAAVGLPVTMLSGRGLGFSGGTIDKLESLPGLSCDLDQTAMKGILDELGWTNAKASESVARADRKLYVLRDATETVDSIPLITASILSKKIAGGASHLCLDVKCGSGAFMKTRAQARELAENLVKVGNQIGLEVGLSVAGILSRMDEPLGHAVGNYLELMESVDYLRKVRKTALMELVFALGEKMLVQCGFCSSAEARARMTQAVEGGEALNRLVGYLRMTGAETGEIEKLMARDFDNPALPRVAVTAERDGYIGAIHGERLGHLMVGLGAGRQKMNDAIDPLAGVLLATQVGDAVKTGEPLLWIYGTRRHDPSFGRGLRECFTISGTAPQPAPVFFEEF